MICHTFGSTYFQSAIDLAVLAGHMLSDQPGIRSDTVYASQLYKAALTDLQLALVELETNHEKLSESRVVAVRNLAASYCERWQAKLVELSVNREIERHHERTQTEVFNS